MLSLIALLLFPSLALNDSVNVDVEFSRIVKDEIILLEENVTLDQWLDRYPNDSVSFYRPSTYSLTNANWVACSHKTFTLTNGKTALRKAFFYLPTPSNTAPLPRLEEGFHLRYRIPILGMIDVEMSERSPEKGAITANIVNAELSSVLGRGDTKRQLFGFGSGGWRSTCRWQIGNKIFASAYGVLDEYDDIRDPLVAAFGYLPISEFSIDGFYSNTELPFYRSNLNPDSILFDLSYQYLTVHQNDAQDLLNLYCRNATDTLDLDETARVFRDWIGLFRNSDTNMRARAYIFADVVLNSLHGRFLGRYMWDLDKTFIRQLQSIGARLVEGRTEGYVYERSWLKHAYTISPNDTVGDLALMIMLLRGYQLEADCRDCGRCFHNIIIEGERYLTRAKNDLFSGWVHRFLGLAYSDSYYLSKGYPSISSDDGSYPIIDARYARRKAIEHFNFAFENKDLSGFTGKDWSLVWRLVADVHPTRLMYICVDE